mgnify:CR=1 FL=1|jgi:1,2-phenylacetyl-CoA epoxidase PaaB subunit
MSAPVFEVFARKERGEPLRHVGWVNAPNEELACVFARSTYDEQNWLEMWVVPRTAMRLALRRETRRGTPLAVRPPEGDTAALVHAPGTGAYGGDDVAGGGAR